MGVCGLQLEHGCEAAVIVVGVRGPRKPILWSGVGQIERKTFHTHEFRQIEGESKNPPSRLKSGKGGATLSPLLTPFIAFTPFSPFTRFTPFQFSNSSLQTVVFCRSGKSSFSIGFMGL